MPSHSVSQHPSLVVVIPALDASATIRRCLDAVLIATRSWGGGRVVVLDNGSTDGTYEILASEYHDRIRLVRVPEATVAGLRNLGARDLPGDLVSFVDADCEIVPDYYHSAWCVLDHSNVDATGASYSLPEQPRWIERAWQALHQNDREGPVPWLYGGNLVVRRTAFDAVGGFDEALETGEDVELCERLRRRGFRLHQDPRVRAVHLGNPQSLAGFCRQQVWHGLGMWPPRRLDKPLVMTLAHVLVSVAVPAWAWARGASLLAGLAGMAVGQLPVPLLTVAFRATQARRLGHPLQGILLYELYYWCRFAALVLGAVGRPTARQIRKR